MTISPIRGRAPAKRTITKFGMRGRVADVIICFKFYRNRLRGFRAVRGQKWGSSIDFDRHPYNRSALPCCLWWSITCHSYVKCHFYESPFFLTFPHFHLSNIIPSLVSGIYLHPHEGGIHPLVIWAHTHARFLPQGHKNSHDVRVYLSHLPLYVCTTVIKSILVYCAFLPRCM